MIWTAATWQLSNPPHPLTQFTDAFSDSSMSPAR
jgi:hypothetical protein